MKNEKLSGEQNRAESVKNKLRDLLSKGFITCVSDGRESRYFVRIEYPTLKEAQELHRFLITSELQIYEAEKAD